MVAPVLSGVALAACWGRPISSTNNSLAVYSSLGLPLDEQAFNFQGYDIEGIFQPYRVCRRYGCNY